MARVKQQPKRYGSRSAETIPARRPASGVSDSASDDDAHGSRAKRTRRTAGASTAVRFPELELEDPEDPEDPEAWRKPTSEEERSDSESARGGEDDDVNGGDNAPESEGQDAEELDTEPQPKKRRTTAAAHGARRGRGLGVSSVVQKMSAARSRAQPQPPRAPPPPALLTRAAERRQKQEEEARQQEHVQEEEEDEAEELEGENEEIEVAGDEEEEEEQQDEVSTNAPQRQPPKQRAEPPPPQLRSSGRLRGRRPTVEPSVSAGGDRGNGRSQEDEEGPGETQEHNKDSSYVDSQSTDHGTSLPQKTPSRKTPPRKRIEKAKPTGTAGARQQGAKRKRGRPRKNPDANSSARRDSTATMQRRASSPPAPARQAAAADDSIKAASVSSETAASIVGLMSNAGWTGKRTWKMTFRWLYEDSGYGPAPTTAQGKKLWWLLFDLADLYAHAPRPEFPWQTQFSMLDQDRYLKDSKERTDSLHEQVGQCIADICDDALEPLAAVASGATPELSRLRALLAEDLLTFVIPQTAALLETAYALGGSGHDNELDMDGFYVPLPTVRLIHASWTVVSRAASWLAKLEAALAHELGYRAERSNLGRRSFFQDEDENDEEGHRRRGSNRPTNGEEAAELPYAAPATTKREDRSRLKPLLNRLQDDVCRARIELERSARARAVYAPHAIKEPVEESIIVNDDDDERVPSERSQQQERPRPTPKPTTTFKPINPFRDDDDDDEEDEDDEDEDNLVKNVPAGSPNGGGRGGRRNLQIILPPLRNNVERVQEDIYDASPLMTPAIPPASESPMFVSQSIEGEGEAGGPVAEAEAEVEAADGAAAEIVVVTTATATATAAEEPAEAAPAGAAPAEPAPPKPAAERAYSTEELKSILVRLRAKGPQLDLVRLAADLGRGVLDVAVRVEGIKNVARTAAVREKRPVPGWAQAGYLIGA